MKRTAKIIACVIGTIFVMAAILWGGFVYRTKYKITDDALSGSEQTDKQTPPFFDGKTEKMELEEEKGNAAEEKGNTEEGKRNTADEIRRTDGETAENNGELPQPYAQYVDVLELIRTEHRDLNGRQYQEHPADGSVDFGDNRFAIADVDNDGSQELIFSFSTSTMGGMCEVVYGYDDASGSLYEKLAEWVNSAYYSNGFVKVSFSHNDGKDPDARGVWPYALYEYDDGAGKYEIRYYVKSWDGEIYEEGFPGELDTDKDGILYYILKEGETVDSEGVVPLNREEYDAWEKETIPEWCRMDVSYRPLTEESIGNIRRAYGQATEFAAQSDRWLTGGADMGAPVGSYLFYDMDRDGRLELITNLNQGTGRYSENHFYSMTKSGEFMELPLVRLCAGVEKEWISDFDLLWEYTEAYQDESDVIYYEGNDFTREGIFGGYDETGFYYLKDGAVYQDSIRTRSRFTDSEGENEEIHYYSIIAGDAVEEEEITEEEYAAIREDYVKDMSAVKVYQNWVYFTEDELSAGRMSPEFIARRLLESFLGSR